MALTARQKRQREAAGKAMAAKVDRSYYKFIGRRGGRRFMYNQLMWLAQNYQPCEEEMQYLRPTDEKALARYIEEMRQIYREEAKRYHDYSGNYLMLPFFYPDQAG